MKLSVVLATKNEEANIARCLESIKSIADEIIIIDEESTDKTREIARSFGAKVYTTKHNPIFHKTKQMAIDKARGEWILQLDADEVITPPLAQEIKKVINMDLNVKRHPELVSGSIIVPSVKLSSYKQKQFSKHQQLIEQRDGKLGNNNENMVAFFIPRDNMFIGKRLKYAGGYPDAVIRLIKRGWAHLPTKSVHEQMSINGQVGWLENSLEHHDSPTLSRYLMRMNRYTDLNVKEFEKANLPKNFLYLLAYTTYKPAVYFTKLYLRHKGIKDGMRGFLWSLLSALHFPLAYYKYYTS
jgi:glycosyltransferase involved in cell wall biosynthesis